VRLTVIEAACPLFLLFRTPAQASTSAKTNSPAPGPPPEAPGWSTDFVLQDTLANAVTEARFEACFRNPDVGLGFQLVVIDGQVRGFTLCTGYLLCQRDVH
jgi:hypothetical protein